MKFKILFLALLVSISFSVSAQFIGPKAHPNLLKLGDVSVPTTKNFFRPAIGITASVSDGTTLAGGVGLSWEHDTWNAAGQAWAQQYSISGIAFLDTRASVVGGLALGVLGLLNIGPGYNFTTKKFVLLTGVQIPF